MCSKISAPPGLALCRRAFLAEINTLRLKLYNQRPRRTDMSPLSSKTEELRHISPMQQVIAVIVLCLLGQYLISLLAILEFFPNIAGKSLNGIFKNHTFLIPGILAFSAAFFFEGKAGLYRILQPYKIIPQNPIWWLFATFSVLLLITIALYLDDTLYQRPLTWHPIDLPSLDQVIRQSPKFIKVAICDELLWIGFVYPRLRHSGISPLGASIILGLLWGLDYVPFVYTEFFVTPGMTVSTLVLGWVAITPLYVWLYHKTGSASLIIFFNLCMQFSYGAIPIQPVVTMSNSGMAMANLVCMLFSLLIWKLYSSGKEKDLGFLQDSGTKNSLLHRA